MKRVLVPAVIDPAAPPRDAPIHSLDGRTMGTTWSVKAVGGEPAALRTGIEQCLDAVVHEMSHWELTSALSRFNGAAMGTWCELPPDAFEVLLHALRIADQTDGAYDPAAGALVDLWGFGPPGAVLCAPADDDIAAARKRSCRQRLEIDAPRRRVLQPGGLRLDFSAIAKGFAVDRVSQWLLANGVAHHLAEIGGELRGCGMKPDGQPWWVALETPLPHEGALASAPEHLVALHGLAVATSGDYRRFFIDGDVRRSHTIDPRTGRPIGHGLASVSVLHAQCMLADAWSTALMVLGLDEGLALANARGIAAVFVQRVEDGFLERMSKAYVALLA
jgi:thiamine biosynthesis lipoprotein